MGSSAPTMIAARQNVPELAAVPASLRPVIAPMLEPRPEDRPPSMRALLDRPKPTGAPVRSPGRWRLALLIAALLLAVAGAAYGVYFWTLPPSVKELRAQLAAATSGYQCAELNYAVGPNRSVNISGRVSTRNDLERLRREIGGMRGIAGTPNLDVHLMAWPYCEVVGLLSPLMAKPSRDAPGVGLASKADEARLGECLLLDVVAPSFDSFIYVDYFDAEGDVLHLLPNQWEPLNLKPVRNHFTLGQSSRMPGCWRFGGATGEQFISLIAAKKPLFPEGRPDTENARDYLASLSNAINELPQGAGAAAVLFFNLRDR